MRTWLLALVSCVDTIEIDVSSVSFDYGFVVTFPKEGEPTNVSPAFGVEEGRVIFGDLPEVRLGDDEERFVFVALSEDVLHPAFVLQRAAELDALLEAPPGALVVEGADLTRLSGKIPVPDRASLLTAELGDPVLRPVVDGEFDLFARVTLRIPVDPEHCLDEAQTELAPYGLSARPRGPLQHLVGAFELEDDRAVVASRIEVYVLPRGGVPTTSGAVWLLPSDPEYTAGEQLNDMAVGSPRSDGSREILAVGGFMRRGSEVPDFGKIWRLRLDGDRVTRDGPIDLLAGDWFRVVAYLPDGRAFTAVEDGRIWSRADESSPWVDEVALTVRTDVPKFVGQLTPTGDDEFPLMASTKNYVHIMASNGTWSPEMLNRGGLLGPESSNLRGLGLVRDGGVPDFWAAGQRGQIGRRTGSRPFELLENMMMSLDYPPRFAACASSANPGEPLTFNKEINDLVAVGEHVFMGYETCSALVVVRRSDRCVWMLPLAGEGPTFTERSINTMSRRGSRILVATGDGELYETLIP